MNTVWYERNESMIAAIQRENSLKKYQRDWKINLIGRHNPHWNELYRRSSPETVFIDGRDNGPAMTRLGWFLFGSSFGDSTHSETFPE